MIPDLQAAMSGGPQGHIGESPQLADALLLQFIWSLIQRQAMKTDPREQVAGGEIPVRPRVEPLGGP